MPSMLQVLASKGSQVWSISPDATVFAGLTLMADKNIGALLILENDRPVGIMSERDYARKIILEGRSSRDTKVRSIMTTRLVSVHPSDSVEHAMALILEVLRLHGAADADHADADLVAEAVLVLAPVRRRGQVHPKAAAVDLEI